MVGGETHGFEPAEPDVHEPTRLVSVGVAQPVHVRGVVGVSEAGDVVPRRRRALDRFPVSLPGVAPPTTLKPSPCKQRREPQSSGAGCGGPRSERRAG